jgi:polyphosphate kinase
MSEKIQKKLPFIHRDISWLSFNERVLQEATDTNVPLLERVKFLGIFSNNRDEFFRVRVANLKKLVDLGKKGKEMLGEDPLILLNKIQSIVVDQQLRFDKIYIHILEELKKEKIFILNENELSPSQQQFVSNYYQEKVRPRLVPILINEEQDFPILQDKRTYLFVKLKGAKTNKKQLYSLVEVPTDYMSRFLTLPRENENSYIIMLDDVIRFCMDNLFATMHSSGFESYNIKLTRDAEFDILPDMNESYLEKISKGIKGRHYGEPVRLVYDSKMPKEMQKFIIKKLQLSNQDTLVPGGRYHNFKDFVSFPDIGKTHLKYEPLPPLPHRDLELKKSLFDVLDEKDILLTFPYQNYGHIIDLLREAAIDPYVTGIKISIYRIAKDSHIMNALINAVKNGKSVTVIAELQARFDEENNLFWAQLMEEHGVKVIVDIPGLKVHAKVFMITRIKNNKQKIYAHVGTGNFNESTAKIYSDFSILTSDKRITNDLEKVFFFLERNFMPHKFRHLLVSPFYMRNEINKLIDKEIKNAKDKKPAKIILKVNSLSDKEIVAKLYEAHQAGVEIKIIARSICSLVTELKELSDKVVAISLVDRFLEHARVWVFHSDGDEKMYISSADIMPRNLDNRVEVACPVYDINIKKIIMKFIDIQFHGNVKVRIINQLQNNPYRRDNNEKPFRAQYEIYQYFKEKLLKTS